MDEILKIVLLRNRQRKLLTKNDVKRICEIIKGYNCFYDIDSIKFENVDSTDSGCAGICSNDGIVFYMKGIEKTNDETYKKIRDISNIDGCKVDVLNFSYLSTIFHEFAHARQNKIVSEGKGSLEERIYKVCNKLGKIKGFYNKNYSIFLDEINAFAKSAFDTYNIYEKLPREYLTDNDKRAYQVYSLEEATRFYSINSKEEIITSPAEKLFESANRYNLSIYNINIDSFRKLIYSGKNLSLYKKLLLGLPLSYNEYAYVNLMDYTIRGGGNIDFIRKLQRKL